jgi:hypothetical protein
MALVPHDPPEPRQRRAIHRCQSVKLSMKGEEVLMVQPAA